MIKRIIFLLLATLFGAGLQAQTTETEKEGTSYEDAIPITFSSGKATFTDLRNTSERPPHYYPAFYMRREDGTYSYTNGDAIFYRMDTSTQGDVIIHNWNSIWMGYSTLFLLRPTQPNETEDWSDGPMSIKRVATFEELDFMAPDFDPVELGMPEGSSFGLAYLRVRNLPAGTYYLVVAGYKYTNGSSRNGQLGTTIIADLAHEIPGEGDIKPEEPNNNPVQYQYDLSGNRTKTLLKQKQP